MPDAPGPSLEFQRAALAVEAQLREALGVIPHRLTEAELSGAYPKRRFRRGWRIPVIFSDKIERRIDLLLGPTFPTSYPRTALVDRPEFLTWPHIEHDGILCLLPIMAETDPEDPAAVATNLFSRSGRLVEELLDGAIVDRDFREEFLTYWFYAADGGAAPRVVSLLEPAPCSRLICCWRGERGLVVVGEDRDSLERWLRNRYDEPRKVFHLEAAAFLWLPEPWLPSQYPVTGADLLEAAQDGDGLRVLAEAAITMPDDLLVVMGAEGRGGAGLIAVTTTSARKSRSRTGRVEQPLTRGFRGNALSAEVAIARTFSQAPLLRSTVARADAEWVHGRGKDPRTRTLLGRTCTVVGCGSIGSSVAVRLARAGVGTLRLADFDDLGWSNLGRHELGAASVGANKAEELAKRLSCDLPHLSITGYSYGAYSLIHTSPDLLRSSDLVIVTTGSWQADGALNEWHVAHGRHTLFLYGWTESHAAAGRAVLIGQTGGCLRCGIGSTGVPIFRMTDWAEGATLEEPSCGNHFQPYGAVELSASVDVIANLALDALLAPMETSVERIWVGPSDRLIANGGAWTDDAMSLIGAESIGGHLATRFWPANPVCSICASATISS